MELSGQNTGVGSLSVLQGIFATQGSNPGLPHYRQTLYQLSNKGIGEESESPFSRVAKILWPSSFYHRNFVEYNLMDYAPAA